MSRSHPATMASPTPLPGAPALSRPPFACFGQGLEPLTIGRIGGRKTQFGLDLGDRNPLVVGVELPRHLREWRALKRLLWRRLNAEQRRCVGDHVLRRRRLLVGDVPGLALKVPREDETGN